jgi:MFS family permease
MISKNEADQIGESKKISLKEGSFSGLMEGFGIRYIIPYALVLGVSNFYIAIINTLPGLLGNLNQLHSLRILKKRSRKELVFISFLMQSLLWIVLISVGLLYLLYPSFALISVLFLLFYTLLVVAGSTGIPAWNSWMKDIVLTKRGKYFGTRNRFVNIFTIFAMISAGVFLRYFSESKVIYGFFIIFFIAFLSKFIAAQLIRKQYEPRFVLDRNSYFSLKQFIYKMRKNNFGKFVIFVASVSFAVNVAGPFFAVYMLKGLTFSYIQFTIVTISSVITTIIFLPYWGSFADEYGNMKVIKITSFLIPFIPFLWVFTFFVSMSTWSVFIYLIFVELFSGFIWAGFNLSAGNFIYDAVSKEKMAHCVSYFNIINSFGAFLGGLIGGLIALFGSGLGIILFLFLFIISGILRVIAMFFGANINEVREVKEFSLRKKIRERLEKRKIMIWRYIGFKPIRLAN